MDGLLTVSSTRRLSQTTEPLVISEAAAPKIQAEDSLLDSADDVLSCLQSQPSFEQLVRCLTWLNKSTGPGDAFNIKIPHPKAAAIIHALINTTLPDYWNVLRKGADNDPKKERKLFLSSVTSLAGIGALATRLKNISATYKPDEKAKSQVSSSESHVVLLRDTLEVLEQILHGDKTLLSISLELLRSVQKPLQKTIAVKDLMSWLASGRLLSTVAEAEAGLANSLDVPKTWLSDGQAYSRWLGRNIRTILLNPGSGDIEMSKMSVQLFTKAVSIGYKDQVVEEVFESLLQGEEKELTGLQDFLKALPSQDQKNTVFTLLRILPQYREAKDEKALAGAIAALLERIDVSLPHLKEILVGWLTETSSGSLNQSLVKHRAVMLFLSRDGDWLQKTSARLLALFGDKLAMAHSPVLHQEVQAQDLLLAIGYLGRNQKIALRDLARSSSFINTISNRLSASSQRARFLGMVVGMAVSELVDSPDKRMNFENEEVDGEEGQQLRRLITLEDKMGTVKDLRQSQELRTKPSESTEARATSKNTSTIATTSRVVAIEEIDDSESEEDDLPMYEKPDSDQEDSDEDPTAIVRNKPTAPVYIRDLLRGLREDDNYDKHKLALSSAADLIRRKSKFGTEVSDHAEELASRLAGLRDAFDLDRFEEQRLQAMIAAIVAQPSRIGKWFSIQLFQGDYSMGQRTSMLTAISMAARELAGYREEDASLTGAKADLKDLFPTKRLPRTYDSAFAKGVKPVDALTEKMEQTMIKPMAAAAADKVSGPDILKVRTFSSRMEVEKNRKRPITNELAKIVAEAFFFPLTGGFQAHMQTYGSRSPFALPFLLSHFLRTLAILMSASGKSTLSLPALTVEFWHFLLPLRAEVSKAQPSLEALLFCLLTILEINGDDQRRLAEDHAQELLETQNWAQQVFDNTRGGEKEGEKVRMLAASILVKASEVVEKYQQLLMGDLANFS